MATKTKAKAKPAKARSVTFISRSPNLRLVFEPGDIERNERGRVTKNIPAVDVQFEHGLYVWEPSDDKEILKWLRDHPKKDTTREGAFWEKGAAPDEPRPTFSEQQQAITSAAVAKNVDTIQDILDRERETHNRDNVIDLGEIAISQITGDGPDAEPSPEPDKAS